MSDFRPVIEQWGGCVDCTLSTEDTVTLLEAIAPDAMGVETYEYGDKTAVAFIDGAGFLDRLSRLTFDDLMSTEEYEVDEEDEPQWREAFELFKSKVDEWREHMDGDVLRFYVD